MPPKANHGRPLNGGGGAQQPPHKEPVSSLDLSSFLSCLEQEVGDLHAAIKSSRDGRVEKAFQRVPRSMRRRTASHNAKRLPRRLRQQASRDQAADNTPSVATGLAKRKKARSAAAWVYENTKKRVRLQAEKKMARGAETDDEMGEDDEEEDEEEGGALTTAPTTPRPPLPIKNLRLPTHRWHAKRAHMDNPGVLWNSTIARTPANKTYRMTLRAAGLRPTMCVCWDTSYKATIFLKGKERDLNEALQLVVEPHLLTAALKRGACCVDAKLPRSFGYQLHGGDDTEFGGPGNCGALTLFYNPTTAAENNTDREVFVRTHPAIFSHVWTALSNGIAHKQLPVAMRDFRLEIGSIDVSGSAAVDALAATLYPYATAATPMEPLGREFLKLRAMDTGGLAPASGAMLAFNIQDPRLDEPDDADSTTRIGRASALQAWPETEGRRRPSGLFDTHARHSATKLPPQAVIDKRRGKLGAGEKLLVQSHPTSTSSRPIPIIFAAATAAAALPLDADPHAAHRNSTASATWTVVAPRACIDALWTRLHVHTLPSGHRPLCGGLDEDRHMALERGRPWFPADFPGTPTGWDWELQTRRGHAREWAKKPTAKRAQWDAVDLRNGERGGELGSGFACDWEYLFGVEEVSAAAAADTDTTNNKDTAMDVCADTPALQEEVQFAALRPGSGMADIVRGMQHVCWAEVCAAVQVMRQKLQRQKLQQLQLQFQQHLRRPVVAWRAPYPLMTISVQLLQGGVPSARARIYRLPTGLNMRAQWLALAGGDRTGVPTSTATQTQKRMPPGADLDTRKRLLAQSLLSTELPYPRPPVAGLDGTHHLPLPGRFDLMGFVTSGAQRFQSGRGFGIGHVGAEWLAEAIVAADSEEERSSFGGEKQMRMHRDARLCIVRNVGEEVGHLARWTPISS